MVTTIRRVLIVDDDLDSADSLVQLLLLMGHKARAAYDGPLAIEVAMSFKPEFVFLDIGMPRSDGYTVAPQLRALAGENLIKLVAYTGRATDADRARVARSGFDLHVAKPMEPLTMRLILSGDYVGSESKSQVRQ